MSQSDEYRVALTKARREADTYRRARVEYRAGRMSDADYLEARARFERSEVEFDAAFEAEEARGECA